MMPKEFFETKKSREFLKLIGKNHYKQYNNLVVENSPLTFNNLKLKNGTPCLEYTKTPMIFNKHTKNIIFKNSLDVIKNSKVPFIFKIFPYEIKGIKQEYNVDLIDEINKSGIKIITLRRDNFLDVCLSVTISSTLNIYNLDKNDSKNEENTFKQTKIIADESNFKYVYNDTLDFKKICESIKNPIKVEYEELFNKNKLLNKLGIERRGDNKTYFPRKLYPNITREEKINKLQNKDEFLKWYREYSMRYKEQN